MNAAQRREKIAGLLEGAASPLSATVLAEACGVSRQIIVGDVALLRASGVGISATPRGYVSERAQAGVTRTVACIHTAEDMGRELYTIVDNGGVAVDVTVSHPVYGQITGPLHIRSRFDVDEFLKTIAREQAQPLSALTGGVHLHTLLCPDEAAMARVVNALARAGFLFEN